MPVVHRTVKITGKIVRYHKMEDISNVTRHFIGAITIIINGEYMQQALDERESLAVFSFIGYQK